MGDYYAFAILGSRVNTSSEYQQIKARHISLRRDGPLKGGET